MADRRARAPVPPPAEDALAELNDHLGRFLRQADELLDEWARFGAGVRATLDAQLREVEGAFAKGADAAAARAAAAMNRSLEDAAAMRVDRVLGERVTALRAELERLERIARGVAGAQSQPRAPDGAMQRIWIAVIAANVLLVVLIVLVLTRGSSTAPPPLVTTPATAPPPAAVDAAPSIDAAPPPADAPLPPPDATPLPPDAAPAVRGGAHRLPPRAGAHP
jgi:hypothetical protein